MPEHEEDKPQIELETAGPAPETPDAQPILLRLDGSPAYPSPPDPPRDPIWSGWDVLLIALLAIGTLFLTQVAILLVAKLWLLPQLNLVELGNRLAKNPSLALLSMLLSYGVVALYMVRLVRAKYKAEFLQSVRWNFPIRSWRYPLLGVGMVFALVPLEHFLPMPKDAPFEQFFKTPMDAYLVSFFAVTLGPLMEELFFRGFLYPVLVRRAGVAPAILVTSVLFGMLHSMQLGYAWGGVLVIVIVGLVLTSVRAATGSVAASLLTHIGYNGALMLIAAAQTDGFRHMEKAALWFH